MILAGDVGGTKTRLAIFEHDGQRLVRKEVKRYESASAKSLQELVQLFLSEVKVSVTSACFGVPGPVQGGHVKITNLPWEITEQQISKELNIPKVRLVNDLVSYTAAIPSLHREDLFEVYKAKGTSQDLNTPGSVACVLAPGTGLGQAVLHNVAGKPYPVPSEGGHSNFAPNSDLEIELFKFLKTEYPVSVSCERLLCGPGLLNIYRFLKETNFAPENPEVRKRISTELPAAVISGLALENKDALCEKTLDMFLRILGAQAANLVLIYMATAGVYLGGGIPPKILPKLKGGPFVEAYLSKQRLLDVVEATPVFVIKDDQAALLGAAVLASI